MTSKIPSKLVLFLLLTLYHAPQYINPQYLPQIPSQIFTSSNNNRHHHHHIFRPLSRCSCAIISINTSSPSLSSIQAHLQRPLSARCSGLTSLGTQPRLQTRCPSSALSSLPPPKRPRRPSSPKRERRLSVSKSSSPPKMPPERWKSGCPSGGRRASKSRLTTSSSSPTSEQSVLGTTWADPSSIAALLLTPTRTRRRWMRLRDKRFWAWIWSWVLPSVSLSSSISLLDHYLCTCYIFPFLQPLMLWKLNGLLVTHFHQTSSSC